MIRTRVGYAGGKSKDPTYHSLGDHTESIEIDYDPSKISYRKLVMMFWRGHNPAGISWSRQYRSILFFYNDEQKKIALETMREEEKRLGKKIRTDMVPASVFYRAEDYHQKYYLKQHPVLAAGFMDIYPEPGDFTDSTAVARVNAYIGGYGNADRLRAEIDSLGLSNEQQKYLLKRVDPSSLLQGPSCGFKE